MAVVVHVIIESVACHLCMDMLLSSPCPLPQGMMTAYGQHYMPMQGPHEGLLSVATMPPHHAGGPFLPLHHLQQGMPGYPGMPHQGKGHCPSHIQSCLSCWRVYLVHRLHRRPSVTEQSELSPLKQSHVTPKAYRIHTHLQI